MKSFNYEVRTTKFGRLKVFMVSCCIRIRVDLVLQAISYLMLSILISIIFIIEFLHALKNKVFLEKLYGNHADQWYSAQAIVQE